MDLAAGYLIEDPAVLVPWGINQEQLLTLLPVKTHHVTAGYHTIECVSLGGLRHSLGFHFQPRASGILAELEVFRRSYPDLRQSFDEFQAHLVGSFGPPTGETPGDEGLPNYTWSLGSAEVTHYVFDRFGPEEHVRLRRR